MTGWFNHTFRGTALTVEYGAHPSAHRHGHVVPDQMLRIFGRAGCGVARSLC